MPVAISLFILFWFVSLTNGLGLLDNGPIYKHRFHGRFFHVGNRQSPYRFNTNNGNYNNINNNKSRLLWTNAAKFGGGGAVDGLRMASYPTDDEATSRRPILKAQPSTPGWKGDRLNRLTEWAVSDEANRPIVCEYEPEGIWLWSQYNGTVLSMTTVPVCLTMAMCIGVDVLAHALLSTDSSSSWPLFTIPPADNVCIQQLHGIRSLWDYQVTLCTFILTFFTQEAYRHYRTVYLTTRAIQGRINDICLLITMGAMRGEQIPMSENTIVTGYNNDSQALVETCTRLIRLSHTFYWASMPTNSNGVGDNGEASHHEWIENAYSEETAIGPLFLSPDGLSKLVRAGELTSQEREALLESGLPPSQYAYILLEWVGLYAMNGMKAFYIICDDGFEENLLRQITALRGEYFNIQDYAAGRMPLAYVQLVQVLVDSLILIAPLALYPELGAFSIPLCGLLTLFFKGLLQLSKSFLDPFGVEGSPGQNIRVDVLVSETNFGAASRWVKAGQCLPTLSNERNNNKVYQQINGEKNTETTTK